MIRSFTAVAASAALSIVPPAAAGPFIEAANNTIPFGGNTTTGQLYEGNQRAVRKEEENIGDHVGIDQFSPLPKDQQDTLFQLATKFERPSNHRIPRGLGWSATRSLRKVPFNENITRRDRRTGRV